ncbi:uncharacterized protein si:dkey-27h10.2 isoform X2 [Girardinichthys multiradiatus]|uniref:uncharacterized protein si:dkey-27h10.2 isoform X2 n=1 Tax=Girardinichthys multiradiatus TaxID=208333 RepID=UPI001FAC2226|nr:uncharacterized protein si:dkey-27h10.2 isoform X2 [Girardinichthys multiradiatus]
MPSIYLWFLELVLTSVVANCMTTSQGFNSSEASDAITVVTNNSNTNSTRNISEILSTTESRNASDESSTITPTTDNSTGFGTAIHGGDGNSLTTVSEIPSTTPVPYSKRSATMTKSTPTTTKNNSSTAGDNTGIIVLVIIIIVIFGFGVACFVVRKRGRHDSVEFASRADENFPLSTVEPEVLLESTPQNGLKSFESTETTAKEPQGPKVAPETQEEKKEASICAAAPNAEPAAPTEAPAAAPPEVAPAAPPPDCSEEKPKADDAKPSSSALVEPLADEKTDDEGVASNKTSVESLKETNENNSNNFGFSQRRDRTNMLWEVRVDCPE